MSGIRRSGRIAAPALTGFILCLGAIFVEAGPNPQSRLAPANAGEARSNEVWPPPRIMDVAGIAAGMAVAEIGAGRGRNVVHLADRVGPSGKVYAEDIDAKALQFLEERCRRAGFDNVEAILGGLTEPRLPAGALDAILVIGSYQHFSDPVALMRNARAALKEGGRAAIVDRFAETDGPNDVSEETMLAQMERAGFVFERIERAFGSEAGAVYLFRFSPGPSR
jgi:ubiquinone/menaquinone biosynthesis C-methylase UbiE